ncbi:MAG TPA: putative DNA modification/repair radical SAM protein, partial [Bradyrhizobium sp.]
GLFLSSGIIQSPDYTMEQLVRVARLLRTQHEYNGYIHLKAVPGAAEELLAEAGRYADRLSANVELPTDPDLRSLAPEKSFPQIRAAMTQICARVEAAREERRKSVKAPQFAPAGQSTQMIVGATPTSDSTILSTAADLYGRHRLRRVYYSAYSPIPECDGRLPSVSPPLIREHRLYQADWLMRFYGFESSELTTPAAPNLDLSIDPKLAWALRNREFFPVDVNRAGRGALLRVPGIGARNVERIVRVRRLQRLRLADLGRLKISLRKAQPFIVTADHNPEAHRLDDASLAERLRPRQRQLMLFEAGGSARSGEI